MVLSYRNVSIRCRWIDKKCTPLSDSPPALFAQDYLPEFLGFLWYSDSFLCPQIWQIYHNLLAHPAIKGDEKAIIFM